MSNLALTSLPPSPYNNSIYRPIVMLTAIAISDNEWDIYCYEYMLSPSVFASARVCYISC